MIEGLVLTNPSAGESIVTCGGVVSRLTVILAVPTSPLGSVAVAVMTLVASCKGTLLATKLWPLTVAVTPFTNTWSKGLSTVPATVAGLELIKARFVGEVMVTCGPSTVTVVVAVLVPP